MTAQNHDEPHHEGVVPMTKTRFSAVVALTVAFLMPSIASAKRGDAPDRPAAAAKERAKGKRGEEAKRFPMPGDEFVAKVDSRIEKFGAKLEERLARAKKLTDAQKEQIRADFAKASEKIRDAAAKAAADGTVTQEEAKKVREIVQRMREQARQKYGHLRGGKSGKGPKGPKGPKGEKSERGARGQGGPARG
jgi:hypothetical protein